MTANLRLTRDPRSGFRLETKRSKRAGYVVALALLSAAMALGMDAPQDLAPARAPWTALYLVAMVGALAGALLDRVVTACADPREIRVERRIAGIVVARERQAVPAGSVVRLRAGRRPRFALEIGCGDAPYVLDTSSWKSDLEPMGKETARALDVAYEA